MTTVPLLVVVHYGGRRLYFADPGVQLAYEHVTSRRTLGRPMRAFLEALGVAFTETEVPRGGLVGISTDVSRGTQEEPDDMADP